MLWPRAAACLLVSCTLKTDVNYKHISKSAKYSSMAVVIRSCTPKSCIERSLRNNNNLDFFKNLTGVLANTNCAHEFKTEQALNCTMASLKCVEFFALTKALKIWEKNRLMFCF